MTNRELQDLLKQYPDDADVYIDAYNYEGSRVFTTPLKYGITIDNEGDIIIDAQ